MGDFLAGKVCLSEYTAQPDLKQFIQGSPHIFIGYTTVSQNIGTDQICKKVLYRDHWSVIMSPDHQLAQGSTVLTMSDIKEYPLCRYSDIEAIPYDMEIFSECYNIQSFQQLETLFSFSQKRGYLAILPNTLAVLGKGLKILPIYGLENVYITAFYSDYDPQIDRTVEILKAIQDYWNTLY